MGMSENLQLRYREKVEGLMRDPDLRHKMTRNELLTVVQLLVATALHLGEEASRAELAEQRMLLRVLQMAGAEMPTFSYVHKEAALNLDLYDSFDAKARDDKRGWAVAGGTAGNYTVIYEFDRADFGDRTKKQAYHMLAYLRATFQPREEND